MALIVAGISHQTAPIELRERVVVRPQDVHEALSAILRESNAVEAAVISTCNRTELYIAEGKTDSIPAIWRDLSKRLGTDASRYGYVRRDREAISHLFRVASGIDSMILGEVQIHGQVRDAWEMCRDYSGAILNRLFQTALLVSSRVREETGVGRGAASVSSAAVQLSKKIFGSLAGRQAMILGAGDVAEVALECLMDEGVRAAVVANRTFERATELAQRHGASAIHYDACWARIRDVDLLLCSTASPHPIVTVARLQPGLVARGDRPLCILDVALPRDVDAEVRSLGNVYLYDLDDLRAAASANLERRAKDLPAAESIIAAEVEKYWTWLAGLAAVPVVTEFRAAMDRLRELELEHARRRLGELNPEQAEALEYFSRSLMNKFLHEPSVRLRAAAANGRGLGVVDAARYLFGLDDETHLTADQGADQNSEKHIDK
jgi:glutamyl-tRNA reductase